jgi:tetratricopeptide (TPR) repeat protein
LYNPPQAGQMTDQYRTLFETHLKSCQAQLRISAGEVARLEAAMNVAYLLGKLQRHSEALATLDGHGPRHPPPQLMARWLNGRAYVLTMLGRAEEALAHTEDAALLVDELTPLGRSLAGCITGTRGIALLHLGRLEEAEGHLMRALEIGQVAAAEEGGRDGYVARGERVLAGERWYWLAEIATRRGHEEEARRRLQTAAAADGLHAQLAHERLGRHPPGP